jgi:HD-GYP domain-containing protein (c-di-GMP phosphodiesterase class II)/PAS domain-containing protein
MNPDQDVSWRGLTIHALEAVSEKSPEGSKVDETPVTTLNSTFQVPLAIRSTQHVDGLLFIGAERESAFSEDSTRLLYTLATQASISLERLRALMDIEQQRLESLVERIPDGILLIDKDKKIVFANPTGQDFIEILVEKPANSVLTHLGNQDIETFLNPKRTDRPAEISIRTNKQQIFEVESRPIESGPEAGGWVLSIRDVTWERYLLVTEQTRRREINRLYQLSRELVVSDDLGELYEIIVRHSVECLHVTFARLLIIHHGEFRCEAAFPIRPIQVDLGVGQLEDESVCLIYQEVLSGNEVRTITFEGADFSVQSHFALCRDIAQFASLIPLKVGDEPIGILLLGESRSERREPFDSNKLRLASAIGDQSASAIHRVFLHQQTQQRLNRLTSLRKIDAAITSSVDLRMIMSILLDQIRSQLKVDAVNVFMINPSLNVNEYIAGIGFRTNKIEKMEFRLGEGFIGTALNEGKTIQFPDLNEINPGHPISEVISAEGFQAYFGVPLIMKGSIKGILEIYHRSTLDPDSDWLEFLKTLGGQAAIAIDNAEMFNTLQRSNVELLEAYDATIKGWAKALEIRDMETEGHSRRVVDLTIKIARRLDILSRDLIHIRRGALLHDIGKMGIPDSILQKPGKLTDREWEIMKTHPVLGFEMLSPIQHLRPALDIPHYHHERWDGTGYPSGLKGDQIPLPARIFAIVDVWDAMRSDRPYRDAWPKDEVINHIKEQNGKHFDPEVVESFLEIIKNGA